METNRNECLDHPLEACRAESVPPSIGFVAVTASIGGAVAHPASGGGLTQILKVVEGALEEAKRAGWDHDLRADMTDSNAPV